MVCCGRIKYIQPSLLIPMILQGFEIQNTKSNCWQIGEFSGERALQGREFRFALSDRVMQVPSSTRNTLMHKSRTPQAVSEGAFCTSL